MRNIVAIWRREVFSSFVSPIAYFVITAFGLIGAFFFFLGLLSYNIYIERIAQMPYGAPAAPSVNQIVVEQYFQTLLLIMVFFIPALTMRVIAEERRRGTFELLATSPISVADIVLGKYLGLATIVTVMVAIATIFPLTLCFFMDPEVKPLLCGILGVWIAALSFSALGMAVSSLTENQIVAYVCTLVVLLLFYVISAPAEMMGTGWVSSVLVYLSPPTQAQDLIHGVLTTKSGCYFLSVIATGLFFSFRALEAQRWR